MLNRWAAGAVGGEKVMAVAMSPNRFAAASGFHSPETPPGSNPSLALVCGASQLMRFFVPANRATRAGFLPLSKCGFTKTFPALGLLAEQCDKAVGAGVARTHPPLIARAQYCHLSSVECESLFISHHEPTVRPRAIAPFVTFVRGGACIMHDRSTPSRKHIDRRWWMCGLSLNAATKISPRSSAGLRKPITRVLSPNS